MILEKQENYSEGATPPGVFWLSRSCLCDSVDVPQALNADMSAAKAMVPSCLDGAQLRSRIIQRLAV